MSNGTASAARQALAPGARPGTHIAPSVQDQVVLDCQIKDLYYGNFRAVRDTAIPIKRNSITAFIGPSGCGKSTVLRCLNRMNDLTPGARVLGRVTYHGENLYGGKVDAAEVRRRIGMVFQKPNPFPKTIFDNVAYGPKLNGRKR